MIAPTRIPLLDVSTVDGGLPFVRQNNFPSSEQGIDPEQAAMLAKEVRENISRYAPLVGQLSGKVRTLCSSVIASLLAQFFS
jgi:hypothetical protein